jgi:hypothetical protein
MNRFLKLNLSLKIGIILFALGSSPLLAVIGFDALGLIEAGNPIGPGILAFLTFWPSIVLIIIGSILTNKKNKRK